MSGGSASFRNSLLLNGKVDKKDIKDQAIALIGGKDRGLPPPTPGTGPLRNRRGDAYNSMTRSEGEGAMEQEETLLRGEEDGEVDATAATLSDLTAQMDALRVLVNSRIDEVVGEIRERVAANLVSS